MSRVAVIAEKNGIWNGLIQWHVDHLFLRNELDV